MAKLDIIVMDNRPHSAAFHDQCIESVRLAMEMADFPCRLVETQGNLRAIAKARGAAFDQTTARYVTWVVDFDYLKPDALAILAPHFNGEPAAIFTRELHDFGGGKIRKEPGRHHLAVYRRDVVESMRVVFDVADVNQTTPALRDMAEKMGAVVDVKHWGYVRRMDHPTLQIMRKEMSRVAR